MAGKLWRLGTAATCALTLGTSCGTGVLSQEEFAQKTGVAAPVQPDPNVVAQQQNGRMRIEELEGFGRSSIPTMPGAPGATPATAAPTTPALGFGDGRVAIDRAFAALPAAERALVEVVLYDGYAIVTLYEHATGNLDRVVVRGGTGQANAVPDTMVTDPANSVFRATDVDWAILPGLVERTPSALGVDGGTVSHVMVEKNLPFSPDLVIRVYVTAPRGGGRIDYFADGRQMRAFKD